MSKLPWMQFCTGDWLKDPELRSVSSGARGLWIDMLSFMWEGARRGYLKLNNGKIVTAEILARMTGNSTDDTSLWLQELADSGVSSHTDDGCVYSRRMLKDEQKRSGTRERVAKHRSNTTVTQDVTPSSVSVSVTDVDVGSQFLEKDDLKPPKNSAELVEQIARLHPANWRELGKRSIIPPGQCAAIIQAIETHGGDLVLAGTKNYAAAVAKWPTPQRKFVSNVFKFYSDEEFLKDPAIWEIGNGQTQLTKTEERVVGNARAAAASLGMGYSGHKNGDAGRPTETPTGDGRRLQTLAGRVSGKVPTGD